MGFLDFLFGKKEENNKKTDDMYLEEDKSLLPKTRVTVGKAPTEQNKVYAIKAIREHTGCGLKTAKTLAENLPVTLEVWEPDAFAKMMRKYSYPVNDDFGNAAAAHAVSGEAVHKEGISLRIEAVKPDGDRVGAVKALREYLGYDLRTAKNTIETLPQIIQVSEDKGLTEALKRCGYSVVRMPEDE